MKRQLKINRWFVAVFACVAVAAGAGSAAERGRDSVPKSGAAVSHEDSSPGGAANPGGVNKSGAESAGKAVGDAGKPSDLPRGIDLVRPDDGYASPGLRRRAIRSSLVATGQKKLQNLPTVALTPHLVPGAAIESVRNSTGVATPSSTGATRPDSFHTVPAMPVSPGLAKNSLGIVVNEIRHPETHVTATGMVAPITGINGTTMGHANGMIGGPAKERSGINGSAFRPKF
jgi:hypothetical protein